MVLAPGIIDTFLLVQVATRSWRLAALLHHTDGEREYAYDRAAKSGKLDKGLDEAGTKGWLVVDMKDDWTTVFKPDSAATAAAPSN